MVGKARSSNFTLSEKLDLLKLVKPYVKILEEHTNKHSVIVEKNKCWDIIADNYNAIGVDRPPRTAQGLRTLYKRLKEYAKQELLQQKETHSDCKSSISEPTKKVVEMIPQISNVCLRDRSGAQRLLESFYSAIVLPKNNKRKKSLNILALVSIKKQLLVPVHHRQCWITILLQS
uniref:Fibrinogen silencer binding protein n=1 Tax=Gallus gallus TaxID=9031 RepID=A0A8V0Y8K2_CHICK